MLLRQQITLFGSPEAMTSSQDFLGQEQAHTEMLQPTAKGAWSIHA